MVVVFKRVNVMEHEQKGLPTAFVYERVYHAANKQNQYHDKNSDYPTNEHGSKYCHMIAEC